MIRLPIYIIIDTTAKKLNNFLSFFLQTILVKMRCDPYSMETCYFSFLLHNNKSLIEKTRLADIFSINIDDVLCSFKEAQKEIAEDTQGKYLYTQQEKNRLNALLKDIINVDFIRTTIDFKGDRRPMIIDINNETIGIEILQTHKERIEILDELDDWNILAAYIEYLIKDIYNGHPYDYKYLITFSLFKNNQNNHI